ncbi:hypothetical protein E1B28_001203 [Marasmius oreades]|uniref:HhH-GPD domain-containing protein n=1 Tax=Marasmius oreades TaxID=181124 RepID=A0A9P7V326_9AGAR|nr:uncharacterized protein E1B28_001203 [Marasmius oreades]KAG7099347.1 hypothetical protein E1B28_001203 [Marasmius oreades]
MSKTPSSYVSSPYFQNTTEDLYRKLEALKPSLVQECVAHDPWKLLVAVTLLNKTTARVALPVFWNLMSKWETPWAMSQANERQLRDLIHPLGTYTIRSRRLIELSKAYLIDPPTTYDARPSRPRVPSPSKNSKSTRLKPDLPPLSSPRLREGRVRYPATPISHLPGAGPYALDSYRIFCTTYDDPFSEEWKLVIPTDKELIAYLRWKWAINEHMEWFPETGSTQPATPSYLSRLLIYLALRREGQNMNQILN